MTQHSNGNLSPNGCVSSLYGHETNRMYRQSYGLTHNGIWDWGQSKVGVYYEKTNNTRLEEGSTGKVEGMINSDKYNTSRLESYRTTGELNIPLFWLVEQTLTVGAEWNRDELNEPASMQAATVSGAVLNGVPGTAARQRVG